MSLSDLKKAKTWTTIDFESDRQLVKMCMMFLQANNWIEKQNGRWLITDKGKEKMKMYFS